MNCTIFDHWLQETSSQRQRVLPAEAVDHLAECAACRSRWAAEEQLDVAIRAWQSVPLPDPPTDRLVAAVLHEAHRLQPVGLGDERVAIREARLSEKPGFQRSSARLVWTTVACALTVLLAVSWGLRTERPTDELAQRPSNGRNRATLVPVSDSVAALWTDVQRTSRSVAKDTVRSLAAPKFEDVLPLTAGPDAPTVNPATQASQVDARLATPTWRPFSEPISERVNTAFGFLGDVLPATSAGSAG
jgi:hypothetical protein